jgi:hypothetical protein
LFVAACGASSPPATKPPSPKPVKKISVKDVVQPVAKVDEPRYGEYSEYSEHDDEPVAECKDPESAYGRIELPPPPPDWDAMESRGWVDVGEPIFREGCIEPTILAYALDDVNESLVGCFHDASADAFSLRVRARFESSYSSYPEVSVELRFPRRDEFETYEYDRVEPVIDHAGLRGCLEGVLGSISYLGYDPQLPAVVDLPMERGFPGEGGVVGGTWDAPPPPPPPKQN